MPCTKARVCICCAAGTAKVLRAAGIPCEIVLKIHEGRPNPIDLIKNGEIALIMLTSTGDQVCEAEVKGRGGQEGCSRGIRGRSH